MALFGLLFDGKQRKNADPHKQRVNYIEGLWHGYFDSILYASIDYEMSEESAVKRIKIAARLADEALAQHEERWVP
jgi:hypothetical protein